MDEQEAMNDMLVSKFIKYMEEQDKRYVNLPRNDFVIPDVKDVELMWKKKITNSDAMRRLSDSCNRALNQKMDSLKRLWVHERIGREDIKGIDWELISCKLTPMPSTIEGNRMDFTYSATLEFTEVVGVYDNKYASKLRIKVKGVILDYSAEGKDGIVHKKKVRRLYMQLHDAWGVINHEGFRTPTLEVEQLTTVYDNEKSWSDADLWRKRLEK